MLLNNCQLFWVKSNNSNFASGGILQQLSKDDGKWHLVAFLLKSFTPIERNYDVHNKDSELLVIIQCLE